MSDVTIKSIGAKLGDFFVVVSGVEELGGVWSLIRDDDSPNPLFLLLSSVYIDEIHRYVNLTDLELIKKGSDKHNKLSDDLLDLAIDTHKERFDTGGWNYLPEVILEEIADAGVQLPELHFLHLSENIPGLVAYTPDGSLISDRQVPIKMGKYLAKVAPDLPSHKVAHIANVFKLYCSEHLYEFGIARSAEDIVNVYINGPSSCMSREASDYNSDPHHPSEVYESPDTGVAYIEDKENSRFISRVVLNMKDKTYSTIYGNSEAIEPTLEELGYQSGGGLDGCKLKALESASGAPVMPYLDGDTISVDRLTDEWWIVSDGGEHEAQNESGLLGHLLWCDYCDSNVTDGELTYSEYTEGSICNSCISEFMYVIDSFHGSILVPKDEVYGEMGYYEYEGEYYTDYGLNAHSLVVLDSGDICSDDDSVCTEWGRYLISECVGYTTEHGYTEMAPKELDDLVAEDVISGDTILISAAHSIVIDDVTHYSYLELDVGEDNTAIAA